MYAYAVSEELAISQAWGLLNTFGRAQSSTLDKCRSDGHHLSNSRITFWAPGSSLPILSRLSAKPSAAF